MSTKTVRELFDGALLLPADQRQAWLATQTLDADIRSRVSALLIAESSDASILDRPLALQLHGLQADTKSLSDDDKHSTANNSALIGTEIEGYRLVSLLGQGGMASVFAATRSGADFEQRVAVKLLRRNLHSELEQRLFQRERQALASLEHPNIARLLDGGVTDAGAPYLVMELVQGVDLLSYARQKNLSLRARLALFAQVCDAVNAAHRALIVHRDIKPGNIMVNESGQAKLLDFGIAKILTEQGEQTSTQTATFAPLTPEYAAPEQFDGSQITTATDVFGLGIVLHELLIGVRPQRPLGQGCSTRASDLVTTQTMLKPIQAPINYLELKRFLRGDIDNILRQSLSTAPNERYASAGELAADLRRFLDGLPVQAHPPSSWYRTKKFVRRNVGAVMLCSLLLLGIFGATGIAISQAKQARAESARANAVRDFVVSLFETAEADKPRDQRATPEEIIEQGGDRILAAQSMPPETRAELLAVLSRVAFSMGASAQAQELTLALLPLSDEVYKPTDPRWINARHLRALVLSDQEKYVEAHALLEPMRNLLFQRGDALSIETLLTLARTTSLKSGHSEEALALQREVSTLAMKNAQAHPRSALQALSAETNHLVVRHRFKESLERADFALAFQKAQALPLSNEVLLLHGSIANSASALGDAVRGEAAYRDAIALSERLYRRPHRDTAWYVGLLGSYLVALGRYDEAEPLVLRGLTMRRDLLGEANPDTLFAVVALGRLRASQNRTDEALTALTEGVVICVNTKLKHQACVRLLQIRGQIYAKKPDFTAAEADLNAAIALQREISGEDDVMIAPQFGALAEMQRLAGRYDAAIASVERALGLFEKAGGGYAGQIASTRYQRAWINLKLGKHQAALDEITEVEALHTQQTPDDFITRMRMLSVKASALSGLKRIDEAKQTARLALPLVDKIYNKGRETKLIEALERLAATGKVD